MIHDVHGFLQNTDAVIFPRSQQVYLKLMRELSQARLLYPIINQFLQGLHKFSLELLTAVFRKDSLEGERKSCHFRLIKPRKADILRNATFDEFFIQLGVAFVKQDVMQDPEAHAFEWGDAIAQSKEKINRNAIGFCGGGHNYLVSIGHRLWVQVDATVPL